MEHNHETESLTTARRVPWNKGKLIGAKPPLRPSHVWSIRTKLQMADRKRDLALFNLDIDSKLRGCVVVALRVDDVAPAAMPWTGRPSGRRRRVGRSVRADGPNSLCSRRLPENDRAEIRAILVCRARRCSHELTTRQYARLVHEWVCSIGLDPAKFGTHSLRRTTAVLIYRRPGNLRAVQQLLGHSKIESTVRYLGIEVDDAIEIAEKIDI